MIKLLLEVELETGYERAAIILSDVLTDLIEISEAVAVEGTIEGSGESEEASVYD